MLKTIEAVLFDLDGTLVDSMWMWKQIDIDFLASRNLVLPEELQTEIEGMSFTETAEYFKKRFSLSDTIEELKGIWNQMAMRKYLEEVPPKRGTLKFLSYLKNQGIKMGIATSNSIELASAAVQANHLDQYITHLITSCQVKKGKPAPDVYLTLADQLQVEPEHCLVFEDVEMGILAGKNAGMRTCAVYDAFSESVTKEKKALADYYIQSFDDVLNGTYEICGEVT